MNKIIVSINEGVNEFMFDIVNGKDKFQISLQKTKNSLCDFYRNQTISLKHLQDQYKAKARLSKLQLNELNNNMVFLYTMQTILRWVVDKMGFKIIDHDFNGYKELKGIEVLVHEK